MAQEICEADEDVILSVDAGLQNSVYTSRQINTSPTKKVRFTSYGEIIVVWLLFIPGINLQNIFKIDSQVSINNTVLACSLCCCSPMVHAEAQLLAHVDKQPPIYSFAGWRIPRNTEIGCCAGSFYPKLFVAANRRAQFVHSCCYMACGIDRHIPWCIGTLLPLAL